MSAKVASAVVPPLFACPARASFSVTSSVPEVNEPVVTVASSVQYASVPMPPRPDEDPEAQDAAESP